MNDIARFIGTWAVEPVEPMSGHTFNWELDGARLRGRWIIEAGDGPIAEAAKAEGLPTAFEMQVEEPRLEDGVLRFFANGGTNPWEFRLADDMHAVIGAAAGRLSPTLVAANGASIAGHRVRLTRQPSAQPKAESPKPYRCLSLTSIVRRP